MSNIHFTNINVLILKNTKTLANINFFLNNKNDRKQQNCWNLNCYNENRKYKN